MSKELIEALAKLETAFENVEGYQQGRPDLNDLIGAAREVVYELQRERLPLPNNDPTDPADDADFEEERS